jgi:hypothetical protein
MSNTIFGNDTGLTTPQLSKRPTVTRAINKNSNVISSEAMEDDFTNIKEQTRANIRLPSKNVTNISPDEQK